ncbi:MAG TPA: nodulation protein NfeD [Steroidobacteraceae bacterium]|nr:nodulation protein NfeD [Steroidobacteraceae bacterium]
MAVGIASAVRAGSGAATVLHIQGAIGPATSRFVEHGLAAASAEGDAVVILEIDTPGGLDSSMRDIIRGILASPIPVVTYVAPPGARAASAGTYILYASHVAAMAPATNLGAATPVAIGGESSPSPPQTGKTDKPVEESGTTAMERKTVNDAVAYIRGLAELRGRNADWAERAVRSAASLQASAALQQHVVEVIARDLPDLLTQLDGREVKVGGQTVKLATRGLTLREVQPDWRTRLLSVITNPTVAYGLLLIGIYGLLLEGYNPGAMLPGVVGSIALLLALFAFQILSVNYAGLALIALGVGMIIAEFFFPTFGSLGVGGLIAFVVGSIILLDSDVPGFNIARPVIAGLATAGGIALIALVYIATRSLRRPVVTGVSAMIGAPAEAFESFSSRGRVRYGGELWNAQTSVPVQAGQRLKIVEVDGLTLWVEPD